MSNWKIRSSRRLTSKDVEVPEHHLLRQYILSLLECGVPVIQESPKPSSCASALHTNESFLQPESGTLTRGSGGSDASVSVHARVSVNEGLSNDKDDDSLPFVNCYQRFLSDFDGMYYKLEAWAEVRPGEDAEDALTPSQSHPQSINTASCRELSGLILPQFQNALPLRVPFLQSQAPLLFPHNTPPLEPSLSDSFDQYLRLLPSFSASPVFLNKSNSSCDGAARSGQRLSTGSYGFRKTTRLLLYVHHPYFVDCWSRGGKELMEFYFGPDKCEELAGDPDGFDLEITVPLTDPTKYAVYAQELCKTRQRLMAAPFLKYLRLRALLPRLVTGEEIVSSHILPHWEASIHHRLGQQQLICSHDSALLRRNLHVSDCGSIESVREAVLATVQEFRIRRSEVIWMFQGTPAVVTAVVAIHFPQHTLLAQFASVFCESLQRHAANSSASASGAMAPDISGTFCTVAADSSRSSSSSSRATGHEATDAINDCFSFIKFPNGRSPLCTSRSILFDSVAPPDEIVEFAKRQEGFLDASGRDGGIATGDMNNSGRTITALAEGNGGEAATEDLRVLHRQMGFSPNVGFLTMNFSLDTISREGDIMRLATAEFISGLRNIVEATATFECTGVNKLLLCS